MKKALACVTLAATLLLAGTNAFADPITYDILVTGTSGPLNGDFRFGRFTFDSSIIPAGGGFVGQVGLFDDLFFDWNGIVYDETTANTGGLIFDAAGRIVGGAFGTNCTDIACVVTPGTNSWHIFVPANLFSYTVPGTTDIFTGRALVVPAVPEPASLGLLGSGLVGLITTAIRRRRAAARAH